jgi:hypothetical protein
VLASSIALSLTIFSIPKAFAGLADIQQRNAIGSWVRLGPSVDVILCGDDPGVADAAHALGVRHISTIERNAEGTPLVSDAFARTTAASTASLMCYANADIMFMSDFAEALGRIPFPQFMVCGQRWDVVQNSAMSFESPTWQQELRAYTLRSGHLHGVAAMDFFAFPHGLIGAHMPPFAVGRAFWDNWLVFHARARGLAVVDVSHAVVAVHQAHEYQHARGGMQAVWYGPEAQRNRALAVEMLYPFTLRDTLLELTPDGVRAKRKPLELARRVMSNAALALRTRRTTRELLRTVLRGEPIRA